MTTHVKVLFFALARDLAERDVFELEHTGGPLTVGDLRARLLVEFPKLATILPRSMIALNEEFAADEDVITDRSEVACIPPVSGG